MTKDDNLGPFLGAQNGHCYVALLLGTYPHKVVSIYRG